MYTDINYQFESDAGVIKKMLQDLCKLKLILSLVMLAITN